MSDICYKKCWKIQAIDSFLTIWIFQIHVLSLSVPWETDFNWYFLLLELLEIWAFLIVHHSSDSKNPKLEKYEGTEKQKFLGILSLCLIKAQMTTAKQYLLYFIK